VRYAPAYRLPRRESSGAAHREIESASPTLAVPCPALTRFASACLLTVAVALTSSAANGQATPPRTSSLSWVRMQGAESCISTQALARAVEARLHRSVFVSAARADLSVEGSVEPINAPQGWHAAVRVRDEHGALLGERDISTQGSSCVDLSEPLALVIALMIDPDADLSTEPENPPEPPPPPPTTRVEVRREKVYVPVPVQPEQAPPPWRFEGGVGVVSGRGHLPFPSVGAGAGALLQPRGFLTIEAHGSVWRAAQLDNSDADIRRWDGGLTLCPLADTTIMGGYALCAGGQAALLSAHGVKGDANTGSYVVPEFVVLGRGSLVILDPFVLRFGVSVFVPLRRPSFYGDTSSESVFRSYWIGTVADFGLGLRFPS